MFLQYNHRMMYVRNKRCRLTVRRRNVHYSGRAGNSHCSYFKGSDLTKGRMESLTENVHGYPQLLPKSMGQQFALFIRRSFRSHSFPICYTLSFQVFMVISKEFTLLCELTSYGLVDIQRCMEKHNFSEVGCDGFVTMGWTVRGSNPLGGNIFPTSPNLAYSPPSILYVKCVPGLFPAGNVSGEQC